MGEETHVIPIADARAHGMGSECWCHPLQHPEEPRVWIHHALDCREAKERHGREHESPGWLVIRR